MIMQIGDIENIIKGDETRTLELKKTTGELKDGMHSLCAFLNTDGGYLIFGIAPTTLKIVGQDVTDNTRREIAHELCRIEPKVDIAVEYVEVPNTNGKQVIILHADCERNNETPYVFDGKPYYRVESTTQAMPQQMYEMRLLHRDAAKYSWEDYTNDLTIGDLDETAIRDVIRAGVNSGRIDSSVQYKPIEDMLRGLKMYNGAQLRNAAAALFINDTSNFSQFRIRMARFYGTDKTEIMDSRIEEGNIFKLLVAGEQFCVKHLNLSGRNSATHMQREERLSIPYKALREALLNALAHREYRYGSISLTIYDDRVEIQNPGRLPKDLSFEEFLGAHDSHAQNPKIAHVLFLGHFIETFGRGVQLMKEECEANQLPQPKYEPFADGFRIVFQRPEYTSVIEDVTENVIENVIENLTKNQRLILAQIKSNPSISIAAMAKALHVSSMTINRAIDKMPFVVHIGPDKGGHWEIVR